MTTLKDVAKLANVGVSTASYALNGNKLIKESTRKKVLQAANELGYHPNGNAKNLKRSKNDMIGLFISGFTGPFFNQLLEGIQDVVVSHGYELVVCASNERHRMLTERLVDGAIILNYHIESELLKTVASEKMPLIVLDREIDHPHIYKALLPNDKGIKQALKHLEDKGHKDIGFIAGSTDSYDGETRLSAFKHYIKEHNFTTEQSAILRADFTEASGYETMKTFLKNNHHYPTAFIAANDEMAMGAIRAIKEEGLSVPTDIAVVGFDDIIIAQYLQPSITTVRVHKKQWGEQVAEAMLNILKGANADLILQPTMELIEREST
ncbi:LacI family DNA-binding transcriptional regulator [Halolactibacillus halophilus]|uniref:LacI family DNA-binding transcriptional regulator n=1 Tax=Halolactibacillus halophilus TaxID=306540 RepID=UPI001F2A6D14|nr:LacI family DNA-binding transcriptional regulator [Halolactibacillus halophilus]